MSDADDQFKKLARAVEAAAPVDKVALVVAASTKRAWVEECAVSCRDPLKPRYFEVERRGSHASVLECVTGRRTRLPFDEAEKRARGLEEKLLDGRVTQDEFHDLAHLLVSLLCHERARGCAMVLPFGEPPLVLALREKEGVVELFVGKHVGGEKK